MTAKENFSKKAPKLMDALMEAFPEWDELDAAACAGNGGHESGGFTAFQEKAPTVKGSRGGYGWFQWTGPRRRKYEAWCKANSLDPKEDEANIRYVILELKGPEKGAVRATAKAVGLDAKVEAFERAFERAGVKHYPSRKQWAKTALDAWMKKNKSPAKMIEAALQPEPITDENTVREVQTRLTALKYNPGGIDGKVGKLTTGAILAFRNDHDLPPYPFIDKGFIDVLIRAQPRELAPERVKADSTVIATKVPEVNKHWWNKYVGLGSTVGLIGGGVVKELPDSLPLVQQAKDIFLDVPTIVWIGAAVAIAGTVWWNARQGQVAGDKAYREGDRR